MKLQCCTLYKRIHECIMRGQNEPRKAHRTNPRGERKLFRIDEDTIHNNIRKRISLSLFKSHAINVKNRTTLHVLSGLLQQQDKDLKVFLHSIQYLTDYEVRLLRRHIRKIQAHLMWFKCKHLCTPQLVQYNSKCSDYSISNNHTVTSLFL